MHFIRPFVLPLMNTNLKHIYIKLEKSLNFFLIRDLRDRTITVSFKGQQSIKHILESLGVPHPEIGQITISGNPTGMDEVATDESLIEVTSGVRLPPSEPRFVLDGHLGRLAAHLRMLGFDCTYHTENTDQRLAEIAHDEERILLTRDRRLLMRKSVDYGYCPRSMKPKEQLTEVVARYSLVEWMHPFKRCIRCNQILVNVDKEFILDRLQPLTQKYFNEFKICPDCQQIYWKGSHFEKMHMAIQSIVKNGI